jgi:hypothetical protein
MKKSIVLGLLVALVLGTAFALFWQRSVPATGVASVIYAGTTDVSASSRLGDGTRELPLFDLAALAITNIPSSGRVGLFVITNGTLKNVYFSLGGIEVWQDDQWVNRASDWPGFGGSLEPGKSRVQPVPEPTTNLPWRIRLGIQEHPRGLSGALDTATVKSAKTIMFPRRPYNILSPTILNGRAEQPDDPANGSQPIGSETNRTSSPAGSRR